MTVECPEFRAVKRGSLLGFAKIRVGNWKLTINDIGVHESNGRRWAALPARPILDEQRNVVKDEITGKPQYARVLWFDSREVSDRFSEAVLKAVEPHLEKAGADPLSNFTL